MKRLLALLLAVITVMSFAVPMMALAEDESNITIEYVDVTYEEENPDEVVFQEGEPYFPEIEDKYIFGKDNRIKIKNANKYPYTAIALMSVKANCGCTWIGTGFMVTSSKMLTAAHCLCCPTHGKRAAAKNITFYFGYNAAKQSYYYRYSGTATIKLGTTFKNHSYTIVNDYAVVTFPSSIGSRTGYFGYQFGMTNKQLNGKTALLSGYDKGILKYRKGTVYVLDSSHLWYNGTMDTEGGSSGGPVYNTSKKVMGINIAGRTSNGVPTYNIAHRLTTAVQKVFNK